MQPHEAVEALSKPSTVLIGRDVEEVWKLSEALKRFLRDCARLFILARLHLPLLVVFMSDGTPLSCTIRSSCRPEHSSQWEALQRIIDSTSVVDGLCRQSQDCLHRSFDNERQKPLGPTAMLFSHWPTARAMGHCGLLREPSCLGWSHQKTLREACTTAICCT